MQIQVIGRWAPPLTAFVLAALAALSASFWVLKGGSGAAVGAAGTTPGAAPAPAIDTQLIALALGGGTIAATPQVSAPSRYTLAGVVADGAQRGAALIGVDGKPAKAVRVGAAVEGALVLQSVSGRRAVLAQGAQGPTITLELPPPAK